MALKQFNYGSPLLKLNLTADPPVVEELHDPIPGEIRVCKKQQSMYKFDCMDGRPHPLAIEVEDYHLVTVQTCTMDAGGFNQYGANYSNGPGFNNEELEFIGNVTRRPEVEWAIDNSFDGIYVKKQEDFARFALDYTFAVYLKAEHATFWKLKYHGR